MAPSHWIYLSQQLPVIHHHPVLLLSPHRQPFNPHSSSVKFPIPSTVYGLQAAVTGGKLAAPVGWLSAMLMLSGLPCLSKMHDRYQCKRYSSTQHGDAVTGEPAWLLCLSCSSHYTETLQDHTCSHPFLCENSFCHRCVNKSDDCFSCVSVLMRVAK